MKNNTYFFQVLIISFAFTVLFKEPPKVEEMHDAQREVIQRLGGKLIQIFKVKSKCPELICSICSKLFHMFKKIQLRRLTATGLQTTSTYFSNDTHSPI